MNVLLKSRLVLCRSPGSEIFIPIGLSARHSPKFYKTGSHKFGILLNAPPCCCCCCTITKMLSWGVQHNKVNGHITMYWWLSPVLLVVHHWAQPFFPSNPAQNIVVLDSPIKPSSKYQVDGTETRDMVGDTVQYTMRIIGGTIGRTCDF